MNDGIINTGFYDLAFDLSYASPPSITPEHLELYFDGTVFDASAGEPAFPHTLPVMNVDLDSKEKVQVGISEHMINSAMSFARHVQYLRLELTEDDFYMFNTNDMETFIPGLIDRYGLHQPLTLVIEHYQVPQIDFKEGDLAANFYVNLRFFAMRNGAKEEAVSFKLGDSVADLDLDITDFKLNAKINKVQVDSATVIHSNLADKTQKEFTDFLAFLK